MFDAPAPSFLATASNFFEVPHCGIRVLAAGPVRTREHGGFELFGGYTPDSMLIRVWMRTAVRKQVTWFGPFLNTLATSSAIISISRNSVSRTRDTRGGFRKRHRCSTALRGDAVEEAVLGSRGERALADRLATNKSIRERLTPLQFDRIQLRTR
jgi:hypothetical protein